MSLLATSSRPSTHARSAHTIYFLDARQVRSAVGQPSCRSQTSEYMHVITIIVATAVLGPSSVTSWPTSGGRTNTARQRKEFTTRSTNHTVASCPLPFTLLRRLPCHYSITSSSQLLTVSSDQALNPFQQRTKRSQHNRRHAQHR